MKKYLIVLAAALVALVGCKKKPEVAELTGLSFKQAELTLIEDTASLVRLVLVAEPAEAVLPDDITFVSSDPSVIEVVDNKGNIKAMSKGVANVTAKSGELTAVCRVTVNTYQESWDLDWLYYFPSLTKLISEDTVELDGYKCLLYDVRFFAPNTIDFAEGEGEGYALWFNATIPIVAEGEFEGVFYARAAQFMNEDDYDSTTPFASKAGAIDVDLVGPATVHYLAAYYDEDGTEFSDDDKAALTDGNIGAGIYYSWSDEEGVGPSYFCAGLINSGFAQLKRDEDGNGYVDYEFVAQWAGDYSVLNCLKETEAESVERWQDLIATPFELDLDDEMLYKTGALGVYVGGGDEAPAPARLARKAARPSKATMVKNYGKPVRAKFAPVK